MAHWTREAAVLMVAAMVASGCGHQPAGRNEGQAAVRCRVAADRHAAGSAPTKVFSWHDPEVDESSGIALLPSARLATVNDAGQPAVVQIADLDGA
ncbi:MAG: hypothetical protein ACRDO8_13610, partial [Nocardioidaceae bacterium]